MRSSTSSSEPAAGPAAPALDGLPAPRREVPPIGARWLVPAALLVCVALLAPLELYLRLHRGVLPTNGNKRGHEWGGQLAEARARGAGALLVVGDSRVDWGVDCAAVERGFQGPRCTNGGIIWGYLPDLLPLLVEHDVRPGVLAVGLSAASLYSPVFERNFAPIRAALELPNAVNRLEAKLRYTLRQQLALAEPDTGRLVALLRGQAPDGLPWASRTALRQSWAGWNAFHVADDVTEAAAAFQVDSYGGPFLADLSRERLDRSDAAVVDGLRALATRNPRMVLFRMPVGPRVAEIEAQRVDAARRIAAVAAAVGVPYRDFGAARFRVADESHLEARDAPVFGEALGRWLAEVVPR